MKFLTHLTLIFSIAIQPVFSLAVMNDFDRQELSFQNLLAPHNSGFESGRAKYTASGGTFTAVTSGSNLLIGKGSATWDSNGASQTLTSQAVTVPNGRFGNNCEASILMLTPSGAATHLFQAWDGTNVLASSSVVSSTLPKQQTVNFPCPQSGTIAWRLISVASDEPLISIDESFLGLARNIGNQDLITQWTQFAPSYGNLGFTGTSVNLGYWRRNGTNLEVTQYFDPSTGSGSASALTSTIPTAPNCTPDSSQFGGGAASTSGIGEGFHYDDSGGTAGSAVVKVRYSNSTTVAFNNSASASFTTSVMSTTNDAFTASYSIPCVGWAASTAVMPDAQGWFAAGEISGANPSLGVASVTSYTEITSASLTLTPQSGSAPMGVMCSSTNAAATPSTGATTCSAGSESVGFNANFPRSGMYEICAEFAHQAEVDSGEGLRATFQVIQTPTNAQTLSQETGSKVTSGVTGMTIASGVSSTVNDPHTRCGFFNLSAGINGFRLMYEQIVGGTPNTSTLLADASTNEGQRAIRWSAKPVSQQQQAILANSVSTQVTNGLKVESFSFTCSGSSSITTQFGTWISTIGNISGGNCAVTFSGSPFSSAPQCQATWSSSGSNAIIYTFSETTSGFSVGALTDTGAAAASFTGKVMCVGPR